MGAHRLDLSAIPPERLRQLATLAGIADWLSARDGFSEPPWVGSPERTLAEPWSPHELASLRRLAADNAPPEIRRHGVLIDPYDLARA